MIKKIKLYKKLMVEIIETLCTICLVLDRICRREHVGEGYNLRSHYEVLKEYSTILREKKQ